jgi:hypothetical protein
MAQIGPTAVTCRPWWFAEFAALSTGSDRPKIASGCSVVNGNVNCYPEQMRAAAEAKMRQLGYWRKRDPLPLAVYTLARYTSSEVGGGTPEEKVAVAEAAIHRATGTATAPGWYANDPDPVSSLLLYHRHSQGTSGHPNYGWYGPIHGPGGVSTAPYGRWAATSADPGIDDILIADFVYNGHTKNFSRGAVTQYGMEYLSYPQAQVEKEAYESNKYWVGPLPGVDPWHTFLLFQDKSISPNSSAGQQLIAQGQSVLVDKSQRVDWSLLPVCVTLRAPPVAVAGVALALGLGLAYAVGTWIEPAWRGTKYHNLQTDPAIWQRYNRLDPWDE